MADSAAGVGAALSKHSLIAEALSSEIQGGKYKVGELLPSEPELSRRFGVSRHTLRAALRTLHQLGLVSSRQGVGTQVEGTQLVSRYSHSFGSAEDLMQYATTTRVRVLGHEEVAIDKAMAAALGCKAGEHWWRVRTVRRDPSGRSVVAYSEILIPLAFGAVVKESAKSGQPVFSLIERRFNESIVEIQQEIRTITQLQPEEAAQLKLPADAPGLEITRRYIGRNRKLLEVARSVHPAEVFKYSMRVQLRHGSDT